jgi:hypothetical protein
MQQGIPSEDEVLSYFTTLSNRGRWGHDDQLGTLNLITPEQTRRAAGQFHPSGGHRGHGPVDSRQRQSRRAGRGVPPAQPLGVHDVHRPLAALQCHRFTDQPDRRILSQLTSPNRQRRARKEKTCHGKK